MQFEKSSTKIIEQEFGNDKESILNGIYKIIEVAGRTCYASNDKITSDSSKIFFEKIKNLGHLSVLEHGTVYLYFKYSNPKDKDYYNFLRMRLDYTNNPYSRVYTYIEDNNETEVYVTTNMRVITENKWEEDLKYIVSPTEKHDHRITVKFICDIGISREFNRHRANSISEQSTRYCNYNNDKFGNCITYVTPSDLKYDDCSKIKLDLFKNNPIDESDPVSIYLYALETCEWAYLRLINLGWKPQQARRVLPLNTKTELVHTAFISDWMHFLNLRYAESAHPDARRLAAQLKVELNHRGYGN